MIRAILVDCDGTLHDNQARLLQQAQAVMSFFGIEAEQVIRSYFAAHDQIHERYTERHDDQPYHFELIAKARNQEFTTEQAVSAAHAWKQAYDTYQMHPIIFSDAKPFLEAMKAQGIRCFLTSGSVKAERIALLERLGLASYFEDVFAANSVGYQKQQPEFYAHVLKKIGLDAVELAAVGDSLADDISAKRFGIQTYFLNRKQSALPQALEFVPDVIITSLDEVSAKLQ